LPKSNQFFPNFFLGNAAAFPAPTALGIESGNFRGPPFMFMNKLMFMVQGKKVFQKGCP